MSYANVEDLLLYGPCEEQMGTEKEKWEEYARNRKDVYDRLTPQHVQHSMISEANWVLRSQYASCEPLGLEIHQGDICFMDFGQAYLNEMGYQHFGLVMALCQKKALVIPMTSNTVQYDSAYDPLQNPNGKMHLMRIGQIEGLNKPSVLFLNDMKFVNTARVIGVKASIPSDDALFRKIQQRMLQIMFAPEKS